MRRVALYSRVSTAEQHPEAQLHPLRGYAASRGLEVVEEYVDAGQSGAKARRPALDRLVADSRRRRFDGVACVKLDRLARSVQHLTTLVGDFEALGIDLVVLDQAIDTSTPSGRLLFHVLGSIAEFERDLIRERTRAGLQAARRRGKKLGRPRKLDAQAARRIRNLHATGHSTRQIAKLVEVSKDSVARELRRQRGRSPGASGYVPVRPLPD